MRSIVYGLLALAAAVAFVGESIAETTLTQRDRRGPVAVTVTAEPSRDSVKVSVRLDTHSVDLSGIAFDRIVFLRAADGTDVGATSVETKGSGHHRSAMLAFPRAAGAPLVVVVRDVGGVQERVFAWDASATQ